MFFSETFFTGVRNVVEMDTNSFHCVFAAIGAASSVTKDITQQRRYAGNKGRLLSKHDYSLGTSREPHPQVVVRFRPLRRQNPMTVTFH